MRRPDKVGDVVAHQAAIVEEAVLLQDARRPHVEAPGRRTIPNRLDPQVLLEDVELFLAPNPGETARPLARIASGGELSYNFV